MKSKRKILSLYVALLMGSPGFTATDANARGKSNLPDSFFAIAPGEAAANQNYDQPYRPQFHYTPMQGFVGDATGLIYYQGDYHLFYMSDKWERRKNLHKRWGHAFSTDCLHWEEESSILDPVADHKPGSGSGIVDWNNTLGLATGKEKTLVVFYTDYKLGSCIAYSTDAGQTWTHFPKNPILPPVGKNDRDPDVFWYAPANEWRMVRHLEPFDESSQTGFAFFGSTNLLNWTYYSKIGDFNECPDFFELPVQDHSSERKWVLLDAGFNYTLGTFDGKQFTPETPKLRVEYGSSRCVYAPQSWKKSADNSVPPVQMGFLRYPEEAKYTWHGQMTFPCDLTLREVPDGLRLCREPIEDIKKLHTDQKDWHDVAIKPGQNPLSELRGELLDIEAEIALNDATAVKVGVRGQTVRYDVKRQRLELGDKSAPLKLAGKNLRLRLLVDRSSIEVFGDLGQASISQVFFFPAGETNFSLTTEGGDVKIVSMTASHLKSIWDKTAVAALKK